MVRSKQKLSPKKTPIEITYQSTSSCCRNECEKLTCKDKNPFKVTVMTKNDFKDPALILSNITKRTKDTNSNAASWLKTHEILIDIKHPFSLFLRPNSKDDFQEIFYGKVQSRKKVKTTISLPWNQIQLGLLFPNGKPLAAAKKKDLLSVCHVLPPQGQRFIQELVEANEDCDVFDIDGFSEEDVQFFE